MDWASLEINELLTNSATLIADAERNTLNLRELRRMVGPTESKISPNRTLSERLPAANAVEKVATDGLSSNSKKIDLSDRPTSRPKPLGKGKAAH
ncbi:hypothetical protein F6X40_21975 [Paraburkholderia sp. UCT31]|uniref:hypothetical protein n=1 Tax=Paraburkholderia sp. UCT31 TaxID=2615209 RepID=UPI0016552179|nr:hypothetical protein [Paraburkholderia sp. UCT31]MBC8739411.1 hypothetical protein [Paraburkholderia sp. UCT31]